METLQFKAGTLRLIDQTRLPAETAILECTTVEDVAEAITSLRVRGAPAIGCAAAYGVVVAAHRLSEGRAGLVALADLNRAIELLAATRPTASNLFWALSRMRKVVEEWVPTDGADLIARLQAEADAIQQEDEKANRAMAEYGSTLIPDGANVLTHCNSGALAASTIGTALGAIIAAYRGGKKVHVWVDETRPLLQGARLTAWELQRAGIPHTVITDSMAGHFMLRGLVDLVMVGSDRIAANGDAANKIGTYSVAVLANAHDLPFFFVAPTSTVDISLASGAEIQIEQRRPEEVTCYAGIRTAPIGSAAANPAFDVTPARLIHGIVTEMGVARFPFQRDLRRWVMAAQAGRPVVHQS